MPLSGVRVVDFSRFLPGPYCSLLLADLNADVVRIEQPHEVRKQRKVFGQEGLPHDKLRAIRAQDQTGRNKRSLLLDLRQPAAVAAMHKLIAQADILLHDYRGDIMEEMGFGYAAMQALNPGLVYCAVSLCGQDGPYKDLAGHEPVIMALAGALTRFGASPDEPQVPGIPVGDVSAGTHAAVGILAALRSRDKTGKGQFVDVAMSDCAMALMAPVFQKYLVRGEVPALHWRIGNIGLWSTKDDRTICTTDMEPRYWERFCKAVGREDWTSRQYDTEGRAALEAELAALFRTRTRDEWFALLRANDTQVAPVYTLEEALHDPHQIARGMVQTLRAAGGEVTQIGPPIKFSATPAKIRRLAPMPGDDNAAVFEELGLSPAEIQGLATQV